RLRQELSTYYQVPLNNEMADNLRYFAGLQHEFIDDVETESVVLGAELQKSLSNDWERTIGLRAQHDQFSLGEASGESTLLIPSLTLQRLTVSDRIDPDYGYRLMMDVQGAKRGVVSTVDFARVMTQAKGLYTFLDDHRILARLSLGAVATNEFDDLPPSLRFFAGGDQSVRGYGYQELSPEDSNGENIGGRYLMTSSVEYQFEFIDDWRLATFVDYGNAVNNFNDPLKTSVGVGVRWVSPIGSVRIDVAKSLSDPDEDFRIHFSMGPEL
uniref:autotransporter assembly complex protein TamA n=1 Tax=Pseudomaricurvus sp. TaxID=2004510 RepID=UPI003F6D8FB2